MWFAASLLFKSTHIGKPDPDALWEERIVLIKAESEGEARDQGELLGKAEEVEYISATGDQVRWTFEQLERVYAVDAETLEDGTEVFSRFLSAREVQSLLTPFPDDAGQSWVKPVPRSRSR